MSTAGPWHRLAEASPGGENATACGIRVTGAYLSRDPSLSGELCAACFTRHERDTGEMKKIERGALELAEAEATAAEWLDPDAEEVTDEIDPLPAPPTTPTRKDTET